MTNSIAHYGREVHQKITVYDQGFKRCPPKHSPDFIRKMKDRKPVKRGKITRFSMASSRRLRDWLLTKDIPDTDIYSLTYTLPFKKEVFTDNREEVLRWWKESLNRVFTGWKYHYKNFGIVFRVELQKRRAPHMHAVLWCSNDAMGDLRCRFLKEIIAVHRDRVFGSFDFNAFFEHGLRVDKMTNDCAGWWRYLADHTSKHKASQSGYEGKQWGIVNRRAFVDREKQELVFDGARHEVLFVRYMQRFNRYPITDDEGRVLKYRRTRRNYGVSFVRGGEKYVSRLFELARENAAARRVRPSNCGSSAIGAARRFVQCPLPL